MGLNEMSFKTGFFFPPFTRYLGFLILAIGVIAVFTNGIQVFFIAVIGFTVATTSVGVLLDPSNDKFKVYTSVMFVKFGKWQALNDFPYLTVLEITEKTSMQSHANVNFSQREMVYRITMLNHNHYQRILLKQLKDKDEAHTEAASLADLLGAEKVIFSPGYSKD
jgi:hypothetical protein